MEYGASELIQSEWDVNKAYFQIVSAPYAEISTQSFARILWNLNEPETDGCTKSLASENQ